MGNLRFFLVFASAPFVVFACSGGGSGDTAEPDSGAPTPTSTGTSPVGSSPSPDGGPPITPTDAGPTTIQQAGFPCDQVGSLAFFCDNFEAPQIDTSWTQTITQGSATLAHDASLGGAQLVSLGFSPLPQGGRVHLTHARVPAAGGPLSIRFRFRIPSGAWMRSYSATIMALEGNGSDLDTLLFLPLDNGNGAGSIIGPIVGNEAPVSWTVAPDTAYCFVLGVGPGQVFAEGPGDSAVRTLAAPGESPNHVEIGWDTGPNPAAANLFLQYDDVALSTSPIACPE